MIFGEPVVTKLFNVILNHLPKGHYYEMRNRYSYAVTFCATEGAQANFHCDGCTYVSDYQHALLLPMGRDYILECTATGEFPLICFYTTEPLNNREFASIPISSPYYYLQTFERIRNLVLYPHPGSAVQAFSLFYDMLSHLENELDFENPILKQAVSYIDKNFADPDISIEDIAAQAYISPSYFYRIFKAQYSVSPKQYIVSARINKARIMLMENSGLSVSEIARECGFTNLYHFDRIFKEKTGQSPTEFSRLYKNIL